MIFLSASIPYEERHKKYLETADIIAIRDAVRALAMVVIPKTQLVYGGHPAITPLINHVAQSLNIDAKKHITLYQSEWFKDSFPSENKFFENVHIIPINKDLPTSILDMRNAMLQNHKYEAGIFIGGMNGIEDEFEIFRKLHPNALLLPVASTGAAAKIVFEKSPQLFNPSLKNEYAYMALFKSLLKNIISTNGK